MNRRFFAGAARRPLLLGLVAAALGVLGGQRYHSISRYRQTAEDRAQPTALAVSQDQALADIRYLKELMAKAYGGYFATTPRQWQHLFQRLAAQVRNQPAGAIASKKFAALLAEEFALFEDGHLDIDGHLDVDGVTEGFSIPAKKRLRPYLARGSGSCPPPPLSSGFTLRLFYDRKAGTIEPRAIALKPAPQEPSSCIRPIASGGADRQVAIDEAKDGWQYLRLGSSYSQAYFRVFSAAAKQVSRSAHLIFDLRGNRGGDNSLDFQLVRELGLPFKNPYSGGISHTSSAALQLQWNAIKWGLEPINPELAATRLAWLEGSLWRHFFAVAADSQTMNYSKRDTLGGKMADRVTGHIVIIADGDCMSACESLIKVLRAYPKTIQIGTNTSGGVKIGDIATATLPHSRLRISLGRSYNPQFADSADYRERTGFMPDIWLDTTGLNKAEAIAIAKTVVESQAYAQRETKTEKGY